MNLVSSISQPRFLGKKLEPSPRKAWLFTDLDGTFDQYLNAPPSPERRALEQFLRSLKSQLSINYITARGALSVLPLKLPKPQHTITESGGLIYRGHPTHHRNRLKTWDAVHIKAGFNKDMTRQTAHTAARESGFKLQDIEVLYPWEKDRQGAYLIACQDEIKDDDQVVKFQSILSERLTQQQISHHLQIFPGQGDMKPYLCFEITPPSANKCEPIRFLMLKHGFNPDDVIVAGDGENDIPMFEDDGRHVITVGNNFKLREHAAKLPGHKVQIRPADEHPALGVIEGIKAHLRTMLLLKK